MMLHQAFLSLVFISFHIFSPQVGSQVGKGCAFGECYCVTLRGQEKLLCIAMTYKSVLDFIWEIKLAHGPYFVLLLSLIHAVSHLIH